MDTEKSRTNLAQPDTYQIVGTIGRNAQGTLVIMHGVAGCCSGLRRDGSTERSSRIEA